MSADRAWVVVALAVAAAWCGLVIAMVEVVRGTGL